MSKSFVGRVRRQRTGGVSVGMRVSGIGSVRRADMSRQIDVENELPNGLESTIGEAYLTPPYDPVALLSILERSNAAPQCIDAVVTNVASGYEVVPFAEGVTADESEKEELQSFIDNANSEQSLKSVVKDVLLGYEQVGYAFLEIVRDRAKRVSLLRAGKSHTVRLMPKDAEPTEVRYEVRRGRRTSAVREYRYFRRFVQRVGGEVVFFKEYGDPRPMSYKTGGRDNVPAGEEATELLHVRQRSADAYGVPKWINQLPNVLGSREAEECNMRYFEDNTVPPMMLLVAGGRLTQQSYRDLTARLNSEGVGKDRQHKVLLVEAVPEKEGLDDKGSVAISVEKLASARQSDGLFKDYDEGNQAKVRSSWRLPPVSVGLSQDVTFATANVSAFLAETQVYAPAREAFDELLNKQLVNSPNGLGLKTVKLMSKVPAITNPDTLIKSLTALNVMGALTPRTAREAANKLLQLDIPPYPKKEEEGYEEWMDAPIVLSAKAGATHAEQAVKDATTKAIEDTGSVAPAAPEHGQE